MSVDKDMIEDVVVNLEDIKTAPKRDNTSAHCQAKRMQEARDKGITMKAAMVIGCALFGAGAGTLVGLFVVVPIGAAIGVGAVVGLLGGLVMSVFDPFGFGESGRTCDVSGCACAPPQPVGYYVCWGTRGLAATF